MNELQRSLIRIGALAAKEALHIRRDSRTLAMGLAMPVLLLLIFGYGVSFDLRALPLVVVDQDHSAESRELWRTFVASDEFRLVALKSDPGEVESLFRRREATAALVIPSGLARALSRSEAVDIQLLVDGSDSNTANQVLAKARALDLAVNLQVRRQQALAGPPPLAVSTLMRFNPGSRSALFLVPGLTAYILAIVAVLLTALAVAREWERGSMEQLFATPVGRLEIILGKLLPYLALGILQTLMVLCIGAWVFGVPVRGSLPLLASCSLLFMLSMLSQGLLISVVARNQMVATQLGALSAMLPSLLLSGFMFPVDNMPAVLQWISRLVPARYFVTILRGVMLRGSGLAELWPEALALAVFSVMLVSVAVVKFQRRLA